MAKIEKLTRFWRGHRLLGGLPHLLTRYSLTVLLLAALLTGVALWQASTLRIDTDFAGLLPSDYPSVGALERLQREVGAESTVDVAIESQEPEASKAFAERLISEALALRRSATGNPYFTGLDYRRELGFLEKNALYFASPSELDSVESLIERQAQHLRQLVSGSPDPPLASDELASNEEATRATVQRLAEALGIREYPFSVDSTVLAIRFYPSGSQTDIGFIDALYRDLDSLIAALEPTAYAPDMEVTTAGRLLRQSIEIHAITDDVRSSFGRGAGAVLLAVVLFFLYKTVQARSRDRLQLGVLLSEVVRTPVMALLMGVPLVMSLAWTGAVATVAFGSLNLMTSTLGLVLFGLSIDYGIHFYARYAEERGRGLDVEEAAATTFTSTGQAIVVSAATTAASLFVLTVADFRGFSEFGWIGGCGILFGAASMLLVLPALLTVAERLRLLHLEGGYEPTTRGTQRIPVARMIVGASLALCAVALFNLPGQWFEYDFGALSPGYPEYEARADRVRPVFDTEGRLRNPAYLLLDSPEEVPEVVAALREEAQRDTLILAVLSLQERFPTDSASIQWKLNRLAELRALLEDPFLQLDTTGAVDQLRAALSIDAPIPLDSVPRFLRQPFTTKSGDVGNFVLVYPAASLSQGQLSMRFADLVGQVETETGRVYYAASTSIVAADMLRLMLREAPIMVLITAILIVGLMVLTFRSAGWALLALVPLAVGSLWMLAVMEFASVSLSFYNIVVLPAVLGIGNDAGVHLVLRYREEGRGSMRAVLRSTGEHIGMGALTTLIGFAGLLLSFHPGLRSIGLLAVIGIGATMGASLLFLPALIQVLEDRGWLPSSRAEAAAESSAGTE